MCIWMWDRSSSLGWTVTLTNAHVVTLRLKKTREEWESLRHKDHNRTNGEKIKSRDKKDENRMWKMGTQQSKPAQIETYQLMKSTLINLILICKYIFGDSDIYVGVDMTYFNILSDLFPTKVLNVFLFFFPYLDYLKVTYTNIVLIVLACFVPHALFWRHPILWY